MRSRAADAQRGLAAACERELVARARAQRAGTRQQCRAAARRFVRRHARDAAYLRWVLRRVGASSALAVALLGLAAEAAHAEQPVLELTAGANPLAGLEVGSGVTAPALADLDADGDLDLVSGEALNQFFYFENTGSAATPRFAQRTGAANPFDGLSVQHFYSSPTFGDLDGDGDLDLVSGNRYGFLLYFENTGTAAEPGFEARTGVQNPLDGQSIATGSSMPSLTDLDADGDFDLVSGSYFGDFAYFENTGSPANAAFAPRTGAQSPLDGLRVTYYSQPAFGDVDGDGDLDLFGGSYFLSTTYFENTGSATSPGFVERPDQYESLDYPNFVSRPALGDLDGDADLDIVAGYGASFRTFYLPEPWRGALLGAGATLLALLGRLRARFTAR